MLPENIATRRAAAWPDWRGRACVIVGCGPSATASDLEALRGRCRVVAINRAFELVPWADALYGCDARFWHAFDGARAFSGLKVCAEHVPYETVERVALVRQRGQFSTAMHFDALGEIGGGYNSGFQAINLAAQFGAERIGLVGLDASLERGTHWHGRHEAPLTNPSPALCNAWRQAIDGQALALAARGISVTNLSAQSALTAYPKMSLERWALDNL